MVCVISHDCYRIYSFINRNFGFPDKTIKLWKIQRKNRKTTGYNLKDEEGNPKPFNSNLVVSNIHSVIISFLFQASDGEEL